jgi:CHAT domain-containing protein
MAKEERESTRIRVTVKHGDLRFARYPVAVGHYRDDNLVSAERYLDKRLQGRLSSRLESGLYPEKVGTVDVIYAGKGNLPPGALIIGLGEFGEINSESVRQGMTAVSLRHALAMAEESFAAGETTWRSVGMSTLLIGTFGGHSLTVEESVRAVLLGIFHANRRLKTIRVGENGGRMWDHVRIDHIELVELYEDLAIQAIRSIHRLADDLPVELAPDESIEVLPRELVPVGGGKYQRPTDIYSQGWWRRIQITATEPAADPAPMAGGFPGFPGSLEIFSLAEEVQKAQRNLIGTLVEQALSSPEQRERLTEYLFELWRGRGAEKRRPGGLEFLVLTDRARAEASLHESQRELVDRLIAEAVYQTDYNPQISTTLYELLLPNELKSQSENLVLVLDSDSAQYPWELLADRGFEQKPLAVRIGILRQFRTSSYRANPQTAVAPRAFVLGDTQSGYAPLPGARDEARAVAGLLRQEGYDPVEMIESDGRSVIHELFAREYQVLHLAAHGNYDPRHPDQSGIVLGDGIFLTSKELENLRSVPELVFLNCCHLGQIDSDLPHPGPTWPNRLAASVAEQLMRMGTRAVVAAGWAVDDAAATTFATELYRQLFLGRHFGDATLEARQLTFRNHPATNTWGAYQCYGSPGFRLGDRPGPYAANSTSNYYSRHEYLQGIRDIAAQFDAEEPERNQLLVDRLTEVVASLPAELLTGEMLTEVGEAWAALDRKREAIVAFRDAMTSPDATASIRAIEQCANLECRLAEELIRKRIGKGRPKATGRRPAGNDEARRLLETAQRRLELLLELDDQHAERLGFSARLFKVRALLADTDQERRTALEEMARRYQLAARKAGPGDLWARSVRLSALVLLGGRGSAGLAREIGHLRRDADARLASLASPGFWDRVSAVDAALLEALHQRRVASRRDELIRLYQDALSSRPTLLQIDSVRSQLDFLYLILGQIRQKDATGDAKEVEALRAISLSLI